MLERLLTEVCEIQYGYPFDSLKFSESEGIPLIRIRDVTRGYSETFTTEEYSPEYLVHDGDLLVGMDGEFNIAKWGKTPALLNQRVCRLTPKSSVDKGYLYYYMPIILKQIEAKTPFVTVKHLSAKELNKAKIPLLPLDEQRKIAAVLDKVSDLITKRRQQLDKLDEMVRARFVEMFGDPVCNSKCLPTERGIDFFKLSNGKFVPEGKRFESGIPAYGGNGISWYTDDAILQNDTLVVGRVGFQSGNVHFAKGPLWITDNAMYISNYDQRKYNLLFLWALMEHIDFTRFQDAGDLKKITQKPFMSMEYICPTLSQQLEYVSFVEQTEKAKSTISLSLEKLETLKKALMQDYFTRAKGYERY